MEMDRAKNSTPLAQRLETGVPNKLASRLARLCQFGLQCFLVSSLACALLGCGQKVARMEKPEDPDGQYHLQIAEAKRVLEQNEKWADRAEWEVIKAGSGWEVVAWRVEHPDRKGSARYLPWGYSIIELDSRMVAVHYRRK
jgi:hypothetical protein